MKRIPIASHVKPVNRRSLIPIHRRSSIPIRRGGPEEQGGKCNVPTSELQGLRKDHLGRMRPAHRLGQGRRARRAMVSGAHGGGEERRIGGFRILLLADRGQEVGTLAGRGAHAPRPFLHGLPGASALRPRVRSAAPLPTWSAFSDDGVQRGDALRSRMKGAAEAAPKSWPALRGEWSISSRQIEEMARAGPRGPGCEVNGASLSAPPACPQSRPTVRSPAPLALDGPPACPQSRPLAVR